jgi:hypothetical protein
MDKYLQVWYFNTYFVNGTKKVQVGSGSSRIRN